MESLPQMSGLNRRQWMLSWYIQVLFMGHFNCPANNNLNSRAGHTEFRGNLCYFAKSGQVFICGIRATKLITSATLLEICTISYLKIFTCLLDDGGQDGRKNATRFGK